MGLENFIDRVEIYAKSGDGGNGIVHFRHEKFIPKGGPDGGNGGKGGDIIFEVNDKLTTLNNLRYVHHIIAKKGEDGGENNSSGKNAKNIVVEIPPGTVIYNLETKDKIIDLLNNGEKYIIKGGKGGLGNTYFKSASNRTPRYAQHGEKGTEIKLVLELNVLADVGIVGPPNVGKSTLLSKLTNAKPRIGNYSFTTLSPQLGILRYKNDKECTIADIPGIIEDSSLGKGIGIRFLQHIRRVKLIVYLIEANDDIEKNIKILQKEIGNFDNEILKKPYIICISKCDLAGNLQNGNKYIYISSFTGEGLDKLVDKIFKKISPNN